MARPRVKFRKFNYSYSIKTGTSYVGTNSDNGLEHLRKSEALQIARYTYNLYFGCNLYLLFVVY